MEAKTMPYSLEAEESVVGACLLDKEAYEKIVGVVNWEDFYSERCAVIFRAIQFLHNNGKIVDAVTISDVLKEKGHLRKVGGLAGIVEIMDQAATSALVEQHANIVREKAKLRQVIRTLSEVTENCYTSIEPVGDIIDRAETQLLELGSDSSVVPYYEVDKLMPEALESLNKLIENPNAVTGIGSGFSELDRITAGFQPSDLIIVAGRPSMGKSAFVFNVAENIAIGKPKNAVAIFSLEMSKDQLVRRIICSQAEIDMYDLRMGKLTKEDKDRIALVSGQISDSRIIIDDTPGITVAELRSKARRMQKKHGKLDLIIVDYLQLMRGKSEASREQEISGISRGLKALAKELNTPIIALSQLNRNLEGRVDKRPLLSDLRDSGQIEQDADVVMLLYRDEVYNSLTERPGEAEVIVAKQRCGATGTAHLRWKKEHTRFTN